MAISYRRLALIAVTVSLIATCFIIVPPLAQDPRYHAFADGRTLHGVPNFWNVISNVPFLLVALYGIKSLRRRVAEAFPVGQTGYSQPIPKAGIGGSPRSAARTPIGISPKRILSFTQHRESSNGISIRRHRRQTLGMLSALPVQGS